MTESEFLNLIDATFLKIEEAIDSSDWDVDYERGPGMLTLIFPQKNCMVLNRQTPLKQLWLASKQQGYHFNFEAGEWVTANHQASLTQILNETATNYLQQPVKWSLL